MQSKQDKNDLLFNCHKIRSNNNHTVSYPNEITSKSYRIRYDVIKIDIVIIEHNHNRLVTAVHKIHIVLIKYQTVTIIVKMKHS
jgi:hypothetical protein